MSQCYILEDKKYKLCNFDQIESTI